MTAKQLLTLCVVSSIASVVAVLIVHMLGFGDRSIVPAVAGSMAAAAAGLVAMSVQRQGAEEA